MDASEEPHLPPSVRRRYVLDGEQLVVAIHQHPVVVAEPVLTAIAILVLVILLAITALTRHRHDDDRTFFDPDK